MTVDKSKEIPDDLYKFVMDEMNKRDANGKPPSPPEIVKMIKEITLNHIEHRTQVTKATWKELTGR